MNSSASGTLRRRYAIFNDLIYGNYMIVVYGDDIERAPKWGGFVCWFGGVKGGNAEQLG